MINTKTLTKRYYTISEVSDMFDVAKSLLRYWESEFKEIQPRKDRGGTRRYTAKDIQKIDRIYDLLKVRGFTIEGARKELTHSTKRITPKSEIKAKLKSVLERLIALRDQLPN